MSFELSEEQKQIKALVREFCQREIDLKEIRELTDKATAATTIEELRACQPWHLVEKLHEVGLRQIAVPEKYGGGGITYSGCLTRAIAGEELGYHCAPLARTMTKPWGFCARVATAKVPEEQKDWFFSRFMEDHTLLVAGSASEPTSVTDSLLPYTGPGAGMKVFAHKEGNEWVINGQKMFCHAGGVAGLILATVRTDKKGPLSQSRTSFWVEKDTPGMTMVVNRMIDGDMNGNVQIHFDNVRVPESQVFGGVNLRPTIDTEKKTVYFAGLLGDTQGLYDQIVDYARERIGGGRPIIQHPNIAVLLGEAAVAIEATRSLLYRGCAEHDRQELAGEPANQFWTYGFFGMVKKTALRVAEIANEIYGGMAGSVDMPLESFVRRANLLSHADGTIGSSEMKCSMCYNDHQLACQVPGIEAV